MRVEGFEDRSQNCLPVLPDDFERSVEVEGVGAGELLSNGGDYAQNSGFR
ncbi:MAG: hypothetical protein LAP21_06945 [Acidobacteriia bacterium]|nr:hypothetical protein [Terriglobia bacterium]